ncbi:KamA family radical SAM protein [bacterium]|nr:KamA family radical SAM protein [bacterium]
MEHRDEWQRDYDSLITTRAELDRIIKLTDEEKRTIDALKTAYPIKISRHYLNLIDPGDPNDPLRKMVIPTSEELAYHPGQQDDDVHEDEAKYQPCPGIIHRYEGKLLFIPALGCPSHCRFCFRKGRKVKHLSEDEGEAALNYIRTHTEIRDVIITGGEPLYLDDDEIEHWVSSIRAIDHVDIIRITSRAPIYVPSRITEKLVEMLRRYRPIYMTFSFVHPRELTPELERGIRMMADAGIVMLQQGPLLRGVNDDPEVLRELYERLVTLQVIPYYAIWGIHTPGAEHFVVDGQTASAVVGALENRTSGFCVPHLITIARGDKVRMMGWSPERAATHLRNRPRKESSTPSSIGLMHGAPHK